MELKRCPFCGGFSEIKVVDHTPKGFDYIPRCTNKSCCGRLTKKFSSRETAEIMWNRRYEEVEQ